VYRGELNSAAKSGIKLPELAKNSATFGNEFGFSSGFLAVFALNSEGLTQMKLFGNSK
jgi:hypothetical protein